MPSWPNHTENKPLTFQLADELLQLLSYTHSIMETQLKDRSTTEWVFIVVLLNPNKEQQGTDVGFFPLIYVI